MTATVCRRPQELKITKVYFMLSLTGVRWLSLETLLRGDAGSQVAFQRGSVLRCVDAEAQCAELTANGLRAEATWPPPSRPLWECLS